MAMRVAGMFAMILAGSGTLLAPAARAEMLAPENLRVEYMSEPAGVDTPAPRFSWWVRHTERNQGQTAYQVQVATSQEGLPNSQPDVWDTGKTASAENVHVVYSGPPLAAGRTYHWRVRAWDRQDQAGPFSNTASFEMGLLSPGDFQAAWVRGIEDIVDSLGYHSKFFDENNRRQWVQIDLGKAREVAAVVLYPARMKTETQDLTGYGFPVRYSVTLSPEPGRAKAQTVADKTAEDQPNPGETPVKFECTPTPARYVRVNVRQMRDNSAGQCLFALAEVEVLDAQGNNLAQGRSVEAASLLDGGYWRRKDMVDGIRVSQPGRRVSPLMRKAFLVAKPVRRARAYVSGLGYYELYLNGERVGNHVLDPANQQHHKRALYVTHDVTNLLQQGDNVAGLMLGHGWWQGTCAGWLQLCIDYADGEVQQIVTDPSWRWSSGPIVEESLYHGETYDARLEKTGWSAPGYDDAGWEAVVPLETPPEQMSSQIMPPIRVVDTVKPVKLTPLDDGSVIVDFGQNLTGWMKLQVEGPAGTEVVMRHAELLYPDGRLNVENLRSARVTDRYVLKGGGPEAYAPRFTQHGFRYAEIRGYPGELTADKVEAQVVHTDLRRAGHFECANELYNQIRDITLWSIRGNNMSIPTDCPQRDERMGWMGDAHLAAETGILNFDMAAYYENFLRVIADSQSPEGFVPDTCPHLWGQPDGSPPWAIAYPLITWYCYRYYGDLRAVERHYDNIARWFGTLDAKAVDNVLEYCHYGDWVGVEQTPMPPIGSGCYYWTAKMLEEFAGALGKTDDQARWAAKKDAIAAAYNARFFNVEKGCYDEGSQFSQIFPLYLGIAQGEQREAALRRLTSEIEQTRGGHLATGILGTKYVFDVLVRAGRADLAYTVSLQEDYPSWGFMIANGATTLWELWKLETGGGMNSHNHQMFGSVVDWFFGGVAGINTLPAPGYRQFVIAPQPDPRVESAQALVKTVNGPVSSAWNQSADGFTLRIEVPVNTEARVVVPKLEMTLQTDDPDLKPVEETPAACIFALGSGAYEIRLVQ